MLRVLHCIYDDPGNPWLGGGGSRRVLEIYRRIADRVEVTVATGNYPGASEGIHEGVSYIRLGPRSPYPLSRVGFAVGASRLLARGDYDAAVYDYSVYSPLRIPSGRPIGTVIHMLQGPTASDRWGSIGGGLVERTERALLRQSPRICVTSEWLKEQVRCIVAPPVPITVVGSGVPDSLFELPRGESDYLLYYGRFDIFQKGIDTFLAAAAPVLHRRPDLRLRLAGRGKDLGRILPMARENGIADRVDLISPVPPGVRDELFAGALLLAHPSRLEGLPMVPAEAMAAGIPVVAADVGAMREVVQPPAGGVLVPPDDPAALAEALEDLLADAPGRAALGESARAAASRFRWDEVAERHLEFLYSIAS